MTISIFPLKVVGETPSPVFLVGINFVDFKRKKWPKLSSLFGNYKQILADILSQRKLLAELDRKTAELVQYFVPVRLYLQGFCLILAQPGNICKVFA